MKILGICITALALFSCTSKDVIIADFEEGSYGEWSVEGEAFGDKPVSLEDNESTRIGLRGIEGNYFVNSSFIKGDQAVGKITSPQIHTVPIYTKYNHDHAADKVHILSFRKA